MVIDDRRRMAHLLRRAGFGATPTELAEYLDFGFDGSVDRLLHPDPEADLDLDAAVLALGIDPAGPGAIQAQWLYRMVHTRRPLAEKLALFWHGHFATSVEKVKSVAMMWDQYELFRDQGLGRFEDLALAVSRDPAMLVWLDNWRSKAEVPNENYAREFLELFSLGIGNYTEDDVKAAARAFTGWSITILSDAQIGDEDAPPDQELLPTDDGSTAEERAKRERMEERRTRDAEFTFRPSWHDDDEKTFLGQTGAWNGDDIVRIVAAHPACADFIARKLFAFFVWDDPSEAEVAPYAALFAERDGDIRAVLAAMFASPEFSSDRAYRAKVTSPVEHLVASLKHFDLDPAYDAKNQRNRALVTMGQVPFAPPNVGGWTSGLGWIGPSTLLERYNLIVTLLSGSGQARSGGTAPATFDADAFLAGAAIATAGDLVDLVTERLLGGDIEPAQVDALVAYAAGSNGTRETPLTPDDPAFDEKLNGLIRLTTTIPTYQLS